MCYGDTVCVSEGSGGCVALVTCICVVNLASIVVVL